MCLFRSRTAEARRHPIAGIDNPEAARAADLEMQRRRRMAGAAANILTSPRGIPAGTSPRMGVVA